MVDPSATPAGRPAIARVPAPPTAAQRAYAHVKRAIMDGVYDEGELLSEGVIAQELGVSRTPVREACLQLEADGLLQLYPKRGALVVGLSARDVGELMEVRDLVEGDALRRVDGPALAAELDAIVERQRAALAAGDPLAFAAGDRELHRAWVAACGNALLLELYDRLRDRQHRVTVRVATVGTDHGALIAEHAAIVDALRAGDGAAAAAALSAHLSGAGRRIGAR